MRTASSYQIPLNRMAFFDYFGFSRLDAPKIAAPLAEGKDAGLQRRAGRSRVGMSAPPKASVEAFPGRKHNNRSIRLPRFVLFARLAFVMVLLAACSAPPNLIGVVPSSPVSLREPERKQVRLLVATTRTPSEETGVFYSGGRSQQLSFATIDISIPPLHKPGQVELPKSPPPDPNEHLVFHNAERLDGSKQFLQVLKTELNGKPRDSRTVLLFVHGYNTNMTEAVARFAQLVEDTGFRGVPLLFSWPSTRRTTDYVSDINSAAISRDALVETAALVNQVNFDSIDILAHSMGNFLVMEAFRTASLSGRVNQLSRVKNIILASPDIDIDLFERQLDTLPNLEREKFVILVSRDDKALRVSRRVAGNYARVGAADPEELAKLGVRVVDLTQIDDTNSLSHSKFANSPEIVQLLGRRLASGDTLSTSTTTTGLVIQQAGRIINIFETP